MQRRAVEQQDKSERKAWWRREVARGFTVGSYGGRFRLVHVTSATAFLPASTGANAAAAQDGRRGERLHVPNTASSIGCVHES